MSNEKKQKKTTTPCVNYAQTAFDVVNTMINNAYRNPHTITKDFKVDDQILLHANVIIILNDMKKWLNEKTLQSDLQEYSSDVEKEETPIMKEWVQGNLTRFRYESKNGGDGTYLTDRIPPSLSVIDCYDEMNKHGYMLCYMSQLNPDYPYLKLTAKR